MVKLQANISNTGPCRNMCQLSTTSKARASCFAGSLVHPHPLGVPLPLSSAAHIPHPQSVAAQFALVTTGPDAKGSVGERTSTVMSRLPPKNWHAWPTPPATGLAHQLHAPNGQADPDRSMVGRQATSSALKQACEDSSNTQFLSLTIPASPALDSKMPCIHTPIDVVSLTRLLTDH